MRHGFDFDVLLQRVAERSNGLDRDYLVAPSMLDLIPQAWREVREEQAGAVSVTTTYDGISEEEQEAILAEMAQEDATRSTG